MVDIYYLRFLEVPGRTGDGCVAPGEGLIAALTSRSK